MLGGDIVGGIMGGQINWAPRRTAGHMNQLKTGTTDSGLKASCLICDSSCIIIYSQTTFYLARVQPGQSDTLVLSAAVLLLV